MNEALNMSKGDQPEKKPDAFVPDYKYLDQTDAARLTKNQLATLEAELHSLRMAFIANGKNPNLPVREGVSIGAEMHRIEQVIGTLESYFAAVLT